MTEYDNTNRGALFPNRKRREGKNDPNSTGSLNVEGVDYWLSGWTKTDKNGERFVSISVKRKEQMVTDREASRRPVGQDMDDEIPFAPEWRG